MRGGAECAMSLNQPFQQVFVKSEPDSAEGSTASLLSLHSPVLQKNSPNQFILRKQVEENIEQQLPINGKVYKAWQSKNQLLPSVYFAVDFRQIKTEPPDDLVNQFPVENQTIEDLDNLNEIELKKRQIIENETTVYRCQECEEVFQKFHEYKFHKTQHSIEKRTCKICHLLCQGITKVY